MAPLVRRTWAPRGRTPEIVQRGGGPHEKVSVAAALWLSPRRDRLGLYSKTLVNGYFDNWYMTAFLEAMMHDLGGRFVVVWDGGPMHKGDPIHRLTDHFANRLCLEALPPWAPMLTGGLQSLPALINIRPNPRVQHLLRFVTDDPTDHLPL